MKKTAMIVILCLLALVCVNQASVAADLKETGDKLWRFVSGKNAKDQKDVKDLLDKWLSAQNTGNFSVYEPCYASRFQGVRRTGNFTLRLDRAGWMKDRGRMFKKPMTVQMDKVVIVLTPPSAVVKFEQTWASGKYKDVGPKEMVVVLENGAWKISREELLQSNVLAGRKGKVYGAAEGERFFFTRGGGEALHVILDEKPDQQGGGSSLALENGDVVSPSLRVSKYSSFRFFDQDGQTCTGSIGRTEVMSLATPHFGTTQKWGSGSMAPEEVAREKWDLGRLVLAGHVEKSDCGDRDIQWAQPLQYKGVVVSGKGSDPMEDKGLKLFRGLASYAAVQKRFEQETGSRTPWDDVPNEHPRISIYAPPSNPRNQVVSVFMMSGMGCGGDFTGQLWALWRVEPDGTWSEISFESADHAFSLVPVNAMDSNGSGGLEWTAREGMSKTHFLRLDGVFLVPEKTMEIPFYDCPC